MPIRLSHVIIVGASSGMGAALARQLVASGSTVAAVSRRGGTPNGTPEVTPAGTPDGTPGGAPRTTSGAPGRLLTYAFDTTRVDEVPALLERIVGDMGGLDALIYAAGVMPPIAEGEYDFEKDLAMVDVHMVGAMAWMNPCAARFEAARAGTIVGISSIAGERGRRKNPAYCASKAGLTAYLEALRNRCSRYGVNVVTIKPGFVDTPMTAGTPGLFWLISADQAAASILALARKGNSASGFVPARWALVAAIVRSIPSVVFRRLNF